MDKLDLKVAEIRARVVEQEKKELEKKAERKFSDPKQKESYVYKTLNARYGPINKSLDCFGNKDKEVEATEKVVATSDKLTLEQLCELPLEGCEISFTIGSLTGDYRVRYEKDN